MQGVAPHLVYTWHKASVNQVTIEHVVRDLFDASKPSHVVYDVVDQARAGLHAERDPAPLQISAYDQLRALQTLGGAAGTQVPQLTHC